MKRIIYLLFIGLVFTSCSHRIIRTGYQTQKTNSATCDVIIEKYIAVSETMATKIGEIRLKETGLSVACSEEHAIEILKKEACALNADLIVITDEKRPDLWSSCYRGRAEFYKYKSGEGTESIAVAHTYNPENVKERVSRDRRRNAVVLAGSTVAGVLISLLLIP